MIVTHTQNLNGQRRIYLGAKSSLECWIEPQQDGTAWTFHIDDAVTGNTLSAADRKATAIHTLMSLAEELGIAPDDLASVPFEMIAALHTADPYASRRMPAGRRRTIDNGYLASTPGITRPWAEFTSREYADACRRS